MNEVQERMKASFDAFRKDFGGKVFIVYSLDGEIANKEILENIKQEIKILNKTSTPGRRRLL